MKKKENTKQGLNYETLIFNVENNLENLTSDDSTMNMIPKIQEQTTKITEYLAYVDQVEIPVAFTGFMMILQTGGYLKGVQNRKINMQGYELTKRKVIEAMKKTQCDFTLRTIARVNREIIAKIAYATKTIGNLYSQYKIYNNLIIQKEEDIQLNHAIYCTDFQRENPNTPPEVLNFLANREISRKAKNKK